MPKLPLIFYTGVVGYSCLLFPFRGGYSSPPLHRWRARQRLSGGNWLERVKMHYVYVLKSLKTGYRYTGSTSKFPTERLLEHNTGTTPWTNRHLPFTLVHVEEFETKELANKRERFLKTGKGRSILNKLLS